MTILRSFSKEAPPLREEFAYEAIKEAILAGDLLPNQKISLSSMAESMGISIIPVKSAVQRLISEGLIRQDPHHSPVVEELSWKETLEVLRIRYHLEDLALRESISHINGDDITDLMKYIERFKEALENKDNHTYGKLNREFHMAIYEYSKMPLLVTMIDDLWNKSELNRSRSVFSLVPDMMAHSLKEHIDFVNLIKHKDCEPALALLHKHRSFSQKMLAEAMHKTTPNQLLESNN